MHGLKTITRRNVMRLTTTDTLSFGILRIRTLWISYNIVRFKRFRLIILRFFGGIAPAGNLKIWKVPLIGRRIPPMPSNFSDQDVELSKERASGPSDEQVISDTSITPRHQLLSWTTTSIQPQIQISLSGYSTKWWHENKLFSCCYCIEFEPWSKQRRNFSL